MITEAHLSSEILTIHDRKHRVTELFRLTEKTLFYKTFKSIIVMPMYVNQNYFTG